MTPFEPSILMAPGLNTTGPAFEARSQHRCLQPRVRDFDWGFHHLKPQPRTCFQPLGTVLSMENGESNIITFIFLFFRKAAYFPGLLNCSFGKGENMSGSCQNTCNCGY